MTASGIFVYNTETRVRYIYKQALRSERLCFYSSGRHESHQPVRVLVTVRMQAMRPMIMPPM